MVHTWVALWVVGLSLICVVLMFLDKRAAMRNQWRISEGTLLLWAFLGGGLGAKLAQIQFRHKTRKEPFRTLLNASLVVNILTVLAFTITDVPTEIRAALAR